MDTILFRKTARAAALIANQHSDLPRAMRSLLILINGETPTSTLLQSASRLKLGIDALHELLRLGLIEPTERNVVASGAYTPMVASAFDETLGATHGALSAHMLPHGLLSIELARSFAAARMRDFAQDDSDTFTALFATVQSEDDLLPLLENCAQIIADVEGVEAAARFTRHTLALLPNAAQAKHPTPMKGTIGVAARAGLT